MEQTVTNNAIFNQYYTLFILWIIGDNCDQLGGAVYLLSIGFVVETS